MYQVYRNGTDTGLSSSDRQVALSIAAEVRREQGGRVTVWPKS
jgi:hypothetical protein